MKYKISYSDKNLWEVELNKRMLHLKENNNNKLLERNKYLTDFYLKLKKLFKFIQDNNIPICMRMGGLVMTVRHEGFIEKGGLEYFYGYDNDMDVYSLMSDRDKLKLQFEDSNYKFIESEKHKDMILREGGEENLEYYKKAPYINLEDPTGYYIYEKSTNSKLIDGTYLFEHNDNIIDIVNYKSTINIEKNHYKTYPKYGEYKYDYNDFFPFAKGNFYDSVVNIPNKARDVLKKFYGEEIFSKVYTYIPSSDGGSISKKFDIDGMVPRVKLIL